MDDGDGFTFMEMDQMGLTRCSASRKVCPAPMSCKRKGSKALEPAMNFRTIGDPKNDCMFYVQHETLTDESKVFRGHRRHNKHVRGPDLMVKRHIKGGENINE